MFFRLPGKRFAAVTRVMNAGIIEAILKGERGPKRDVVLINAAAALMIAGRAPSLQEGVRLAERVRRYRSCISQTAASKGDLSMKVLESTHILTRIVDAKRQRLERTKMRVPEAVVKHFAFKAPAAPSFRNALLNEKSRSSSRRGQEGIPFQRESSRRISLSLTW